MTLPKWLKTSNTTGYIGEATVLWIRAQIDRNEETNTRKTQAALAKFVPEFIKAHSSLIATVASETEFIGVWKGSDDRALMEALACARDIEALSMHHFAEPDLAPFTLFSVLHSGEFAYDPSETSSIRGATLREAREIALALQAADIKCARVMTASTVERFLRIRDIPRQIVKIMHFAGTTRSLDLYALAPEFTDAALIENWKSAMQDIDTGRYAEAARRFESLIKTGPFPDIAHIYSTKFSLADIKTGALLAASPHLPPVTIGKLYSAPTPERFAWLGRLEIPLLLIATILLCLVTVQYMGRHMTERLEADGGFVNGKKTGKALEARLQVWPRATRLLKKESVEYDTKTERLSYSFGSIVRDFEIPHPYRDYEIRGPNGGYIDSEWWSEEQNRSLPDGRKEILLPLQSKDTGLTYERIDLIIADLDGAKLPYLNAPAGGGHSHFECLLLQSPSDTQGHPCPFATAVSQYSEINGPGVYSLFPRMADDSSDSAPPAIKAPYAAIRFRPPEDQSSIFFRDTPLSGRTRAPLECYGCT